MIFVTVGTQLPFDRLVRVVDEWAGRAGRTDVVAQIGSSSLSPKFMRFHEHIPPAEFSRHVEEADLVISHAGMGTILNALCLGKPIIVMPRQARLGEHRNDHQLATARRFRELGRITVAMDDGELAQQLDGFGNLRAGPRLPPYASEQLLARVREFITA